MAGQLFVGMPIPQSDQYRALLRDMREWFPRLEPEPLGHQNVKLADVNPGLTPWQVADVLQHAVGDRAPLPCNVWGLGGWPDPRTARTMYVGVESPGLDLLQDRVINAASRFGKPVATSGRAMPDRATLAHFEAPCDVRSFAQMRGRNTLATGVLDRVVVYEWKETPLGWTYQPRVQVRLHGTPAGLTQLEAPLLRVPAHGLR